MKHLIVILTVVIPLFSMGQLTTSPGSAAALVQNVLLGNGVTVIFAALVKTPKR